MRSGVLPYKDFKIGICFFSAYHAILRYKSKYWLARNQGCVSQVEQTVVSVR